LEVKWREEDLLNDLAIQELRLVIINWSECKMGNFQESGSSDLFLNLFCSNQ
jgi:hypothetical protein